jgi:hypothetical protein
MDSDKLWKLEQASSFVGSVPFKGYDKNIWRKRIAQQILESGYTTGCSDRAIMFSHIARSLNVPTLYVETLEKSWTKNIDMKNIIGHVFCDALVSGEWVPFDPGYGSISIEDECYYLHNERPYVVLGKGLNLSKMHLNMNDELERNATSITNMQELRNAIKKKYSLP